MILPAPCIVLAGGLGTRLRSVVPDWPKCLAPVGNRSFLEVQLVALAAQGIDHFVLSLGYMAELVQEAVRSFRADGMRIDCVTESRPLGTGGAILNALAQTGLHEVTVVNGDTFIEAELGSMHEALKLGEGETARMALMQVQDRSRYGGVEFGTGSVIGSFVEKGRGGPGLINAGLYRLHRSSFSGFLPGAAFSMETEVMPALMATASLRGAVLQGRFIDIGVPEDYWQFCAEHGAAAG